MKNNNDNNDNNNNENSNVIQLKTNNYALEDLQTDIIETIERHTQNGQINYAELIGVLEMIKIGINDAMYGAE